MQTIANLLASLAMTLSTGIVAALVHGSKLTIYFQSLQLRQFGRSSRGVRRCSRGSESFPSDLCDRVDVVASFGVGPSEGNESSRDPSRFKRTDKCVLD
jgi:hypothetical protein